MSVFLVTCLGMHVENRSYIDVRDLIHIASKEGVQRLHIIVMMKIGKLECNSRDHYYFPLKRGFGQ